jgi:SIR2-like domain
MSLNATELLKDETFVALARRILSGRCSLFLGAGASLSSGGPTTQELADLIASEVLMAQGQFSLSQVVEYADGTTGRPAVNRAIRSRLDKLQPSDALRSIGRVRWKSIFSVNFDDLMEQVYSATEAFPLQVFVSATGLDDVDLHRIPLYMLHGSIRTLDDQGRGRALLLTPDDYTRSNADVVAMLR